MGKRRRNRLPKEPVTADIVALSHEGRGIAHVDDRTVFVHGALPGERVVFEYTKRRRSVGEGKVIEVLESSPRRIAPKCPHFGVCGGCSLQQLSPEEQIAFKQDVLLELFERVGKVAPDEVLPPLTGPVWGYRRKARLAVRVVPKKGGVLVGFREKHSPLVADIGECHVLDERVGMQLPELRTLIEGLSIRDQVAQIEVAIGDRRVGLVFRNLAPFSAEDYQRLKAFAEQYDFALYEQPGNEETVTPVWPEHPELTFELPSGPTELAFRPTDFTQVNAPINRLMVERAIELLQPDQGDRILDLFCGLGNFTLPLARYAGAVVGVEGEAGLVARARENAIRNNIDNAEFYVADLTQDVSALPWMQNRLTKCSSIRRAPARQR
ncbi:23S rRNA (uracil(1939)-C(5))-methyltransferase RlmD [Alkalilimnicola ehrlichii]|uniref:23S rRNA (uracil(1939)-C(5))-methyltransferase RlmD n=1 Tax=Alkalilimnicola ehrlichii TaxID=351052 RepID=UPI0026BDB0C2|nr:23S rRNA (uracil(1939)-C(5))-methyltransferase RlmD [Alkalilimnicola ehrlichii]